MTIDWIFTFNLSSEENKYYTQINFMNMPPSVSIRFRNFRYYTNVEFRSAFTMRKNVVIRNKKLNDQSVNLTVPMMHQN